MQSDVGGQNVKMTKSIYLVKNSVFMTILTAKGNLESNALSLNLLNFSPSTVFFVIHP